MSSLMNLDFCELSARQKHMGSTLQAVLIIMYMQRLLSTGQDDDLGLDEYAEINEVCAPLSLALSLFFSLSSRSFFFLLHMTFIKLYLSIHNN